jgi:lipooligosaccharide transport system ATP-binding protein
MDQARIVAEGSPRSLIDTYCTREVVEVRLDREMDHDAAADKLRMLGERIEPLADRVLIYTNNGDGIAHKVEDDAEFATANVLIRRASLEDVFLILTGRSLED